jgi:5,10-methylenetetrahydromethanopterin reductase
MSPQISVRIPPCEPVAALGRVAQRCESLGYAGVWYPDSQLLWRDPFLAAAHTLDRTSSLNVGIAVTNIVTRHVSVVAGLHRTLAETAPHRLRLGVGTGSSSIGTIALPSSSTAQMRSAIDLFRRLGAGEPHDFGAGPVHQESPQPVRALYLAATGPRNTALAGELADGAILLNGANKAALQRGLDALETGQRQRSAQLAPLRRVVTSFCLPTDHPERDARRLKPLCVAMAQQLGARAALAAAGIKVSEQPPAHPIYPDLIHAKDWEDAVAAVDDLVSDRDILTFASEFCFFGSVSAVRRQIAALSERGIDEVILQHVGSFDIPHAWLDTCSQLNAAPAGTLRGTTT